MKRMKSFLAVRRVKGISQTWFSGYTWWLLLFPLLYIIIVFFSSAFLCDENCLDFFQIFVEAGLHSPITNCRDIFGVEMGFCGQRQNKLFEPWGPHANITNSSQLVWGFSNVVIIGKHLVTCMREVNCAPVKFPLKLVSKVEYHGGELSKLWALFSSWQKGVVKRGRTLAPAEQLLKNHGLWQTNYRVIVKTYLPTSQWPSFASKWF